MEDITNGLVNRWPLTANANDVVGSVHLTNNNGVTFSADGAAFNGTNQYLSATHSRSTTAWTLSMWVKPFATSVSTVLCSSTSNGWGFRSVTTPGTLFIAMDNSNDVHYIQVESEYTEEKFPNTVFTHILATHDRGATTGKYYRNGSLVATKTNTVPGTPSTAFSLGASATGLLFWKGNIKDVRYYSRVLSAAEVAQLTANGPNLEGQSIVKPSVGTLLTSRQPIAAILSTFPATLTRGFRV
jgi:hypothetical protein